MAYSETIEDLSNPGAPIETYDYGDADGGSEWDRVMGLGYLADQVPRGSRLESGIRSVGSTLQGAARYGRAFLEPLNFDDLAASGFNPGGMAAATLTAPYKRRGEELLKDAPAWLLDPSRPQAGRGTAAVSQPRTPSTLKDAQVPPQPGGGGLENDPAYVWSSPQARDDFRARPQPAPVKETSPAELRSSLGFTWGKDVPLGDNGRPTTDSVVRDPISGKSVQAHESRGGGGFMPSADPETMPWGQRPESWKREQYEQLRLEAARAGLDRTRYEAADPYQIHAKSQIAENTEAAKRRTEEARRGSFGSQFMAEANDYAKAKRALNEARRSGTIPEAILKEKEQAVDAYHLAQTEALKAGFGLGARLTTGELYKDSIG